MLHPGLLSHYAQEEEDIKLQARMREEEEEEEEEDIKLHARMRVQSGTVRYSHVQPGKSRYSQVLPGKGGRHQHACKDERVQWENFWSGRDMKDFEPPLSCTF